MAIAGVPHQRSDRALEKAGFRVARQGKHIIMTDGTRIVTIPRHDPVNANTMAVIVRAAGSVRISLPSTVLESGSALMLILQLGESAE